MIAVLIYLFLLVSFRGKLLIMFSVFIHVNEFDMVGAQAVVTQSAFMSFGGVSLV